MSDEVSQGPLVAPVQPKYDRRHAELSRDARQVAFILDSVAKTSRAFRFYAANNQALQGFVNELDELFSSYFQRRESLVLRVRQYEFVWGDGDEIVYRDEDRESSYPFKLYRDGIRFLALKKGLTLQEIMTLLSILGTRAFGTMQEEDVATLLWRAELEHLDHRQVRGFVEATKEMGQGVPAADGGIVVDESVAAMAVGEFGGLDMDEGQQQELLQAGQQIKGVWVDEWKPTTMAAVDPAPVHFREVDAYERELFWGKSVADPSRVLRHLVTRTIDTGISDLPAAPLPEELCNLLDDARVAMLEEGEIDGYRRVIKVVRERIDAMPPLHPWRAPLEEYVAQGGGRNTVRLLLGALARGSTTKPETFLKLLKSMKGVQVEWLAEALGEAGTEQGRMAIAESAVFLLWPQVEACRQLAVACPDTSVRALVAVLARVGRLDALPILLELFPRADEDTQAQILQVAMFRPGEELTNLLSEALNSPSPKVQALALRGAAQTSDPRLVRPVQALVSPASLMAVTREQAMEALRTWVAVRGQRQIEWMAEQARPPRMSLTLRDKKADELRCRFALGLGAVGTPRAEKALLELRSKGSDTFREAVAQALDHIQRSRYK
jgi:hypothetical protein